MLPSGCGASRLLLVSWATKDTITLCGTRSFHLTDTILSQGGTTVSPGKNLLNPWNLSCLLLQDFTTAAAFFLFFYLQSSCFFSLPTASGWQIITSLCGYLQVTWLTSLVLVSIQTQTMLPRGRPTAPSASGTSLLETVSASSLVIRSEGRALWPH